MPEFELDHRLAADCAIVGDWPLCRLLLMRDARYPWYILVPRRPGIRELCELDSGDAARLLDESGRLSRFLLAEPGVEKLNVAALGNMVPQLHVHHIGRHAGDAAWPGPVWGVHPALPYDAEALQARLRRTRQALPELIGDS